MAPLTVTFRRLEGREVLESVIRERFDALGRYCPSIISGRVLVEPAERHRRAGNRYHVRIALTLPGEDVVIEHDASARPAARAQELAKTRKRDEPERDHRHLGVAVRDAFEAARRRLQDRTRRRRGDVKAHTRLPRGRATS